MSTTERLPLADDYYFYDQGADTRKVVQNNVRTELVKTTNNAQNANGKVTQGQDEYHFYDAGNDAKTNAKAPAPKQADYNFYEGDIEDIHTGELYQYNDGPSKFGLIAGILALLATLVIVALTGVIFHRDVSTICNSIILSHLILACIAVVAAALGVFACLQAKQAMTRRVDMNHFLVGLSLILGLIFFCYFLASAVFIFMYRPFHYSNLISMKNQSETWNDKFGDNWTFDDAWGEDRRIIWWMAFFSIVAAIGFLLLSITLWLLTKFPVQLARLILGAACLGGVILILFGIDNLIDARNILGNNYVLKNTNFDFLSTLLVLLVIGGILLFINAIWNLFKRRSGHFLFGTIFIIYIFIFVCFLGLILRDLRRNQFNNVSSNSTYCRDLIDSFHADDIKNFCPSKYLGSGASCSKSYLVSAWETDKAYKFINPSCCNSANNFSLCPLYIAGILCLLFVTSILIVIATNYYLSDRSEYLEFADKKFGVFELLFVIGIILAIIGFGFWWGFKPATVYPRQNNSSPKAIKDAFGSITEYNDPNFTPVDLGKLYGGKIPPSVNIQGALKNTDPNQDNTVGKPATRLSTGNNAVTFNVNPSNCANINTCGFRVGILVTNGRFDTYTGTTVLGTSSARSIFFNDNQLNNDFLFIYGKPDDLNNFIKVLKFVPIDIHKESRLVFNSEQVDLIAIGANGLKKDETITQPALSASGTAFSDFSGYKIQNLSSSNQCFQDNSCVSTLKCFNDSDFSSSNICKAAFVFYSSNGVINVRLPLKVLNSSGAKVNYNENSLASGSFYIHESTKYLIPSISLTGGEARFDVPKPIHNNIFVSLDVLDKADHYLPYSKSFVVPGSTTGTFDGSEILLLTKDGKGCVGATDVNACFATKDVKFTNVQITVRDTDTGDVLSGIPVNLLAGLDGSRTLSAKNSDINGLATFENVAYDYYTAQFAGSLNYFPTRQSFKVQSSEDGTTTLFVRNKKSDSIILEQYVSNSDTIDQDFILAIESDKGAKCKVAPYNKYCGYAEHMTDVEIHQEGFEKIKISKFVVAHYLAFWEDSAAYTGTCGKDDLSNYKYYPGDTTSIRSLNFKWKRARNLQSKATFKSLYCFTGWGLNSIQYKTSSSSSSEPSAGECASLYPDGSQYSVSKLRALFP
jgi:hypothetical protein